MSVSSSEKYLTGDAQKASKRLSDRVERNVYIKNHGRSQKVSIFNDYHDIAPKAMEVLDNGFEDAMAVMMLPESMRRPLRTSNYIEREIGELDRRYRVIRIFPNVESINRLMGAVLMECHDLMSTRRALFSSKRCTDAINVAKPKLIDIAQEQVKLLKAS